MAAPMAKLRVLELYSGIGGMHYALNASGISHEVVMAIDVNTNANLVYHHNFPTTKLNSSAIESLTVQKFDGMKIDMILMSPPCQPFTRVGKQRDTEDLRTKSFLHVLELLKKSVLCPTYILVENVKGFECSDSRTRLVEVLNDCGYLFQELLLTPLQFGIPNSRLRYFLIAKKHPLQFRFQPSGDVMDRLPVCPEEWFTYRLQAQCEPQLERQEGRCKRCDCGADSEEKPCEQSLTGIAIPSHNMEDFNQTSDDCDDNNVKCKRQKLDIDCSMTNSEIENRGGNDGTENIDGINDKHITGTLNSECLQNYGLNMRQSLTEDQVNYGASMKLHYFLADNFKCPELYKEYLVPEKDFKRFMVMDIVNPCSEKTCCFTKRYGHYIDGAGSLIQMTTYIQAIQAASQLKDHTVIAQNKDQWGVDELGIVSRLQLRYFTPREIANILCFPSTFSKMKNLNMIQICLIMVIRSGMGNTLDEADKLLKDKLASYNKQLRPVKNQSSPIDIYVNLDLVSIQKFDEVLEVLQLTTILRMHWRDENMIWDPTEYGGMTHITIDCKDFWTPNLIFANSVDVLRKIGGDWNALRILHTGEVYFNPGDIFTGTCPVNVLYYPFDTQQCHVLLAAWGYDKDEINLTVQQQEVFTTFYSGNGMWVVNNGIGHEISDIGFVRFVLELERKPLFIIVNVIVPVMSMSILNVLVFLIPTGSGERMSYCMAVVLAIAVFLTLVSGNLPKTSGPMALLSYYLAGTLITSILITLTTVISIRMHLYDGEETVGSLWIFIVRCLRGQPERDTDDIVTKISICGHCQCKEIGVVKKEKEVVNALINHFNGSLTTICNQYEQGLISELRRIHQTKKDPDVSNSYDKESVVKVDTHEQIENALVMNEPNTSNGTCKEVYWKDVSIALDKIFFFIFSFALVVLTCLYVLSVKFHMIWGSAVSQE